MALVLFQSGGRAIFLPVSAIERSLPRARYISRRLHFSMRKHSRMQSRMISVYDSLIGHWLAARITDLCCASLKFVVSITSSICNRIDPQHSLPTVYFENRSSHNNLFDLTPIFNIVIVTVTCRQR